MSSTDDEERARRLFREALVPAARALRERGIRFFPLGPEPGVSAWEAPPQIPDFMELPAEALESALASHWGAEGLPELAALAAPLLALARSLEVREQSEAEVSPFVYVMY